MNLEELQTARDRERQTDKLQQLRESFYTDAGEFIQQLRAERDRAADRADDPFDAPEVNRLTDEINTAEQTVEAIYEKRVGKIVKAASFAAADLPAEADGMTAEEQELFDTLVGNIKGNREQVMAALSGEEPTHSGESAPAADPSGVSAADLMGSGEETESGSPPTATETPASDPEPADRSEPPAPEDAPPVDSTGSTTEDQPVPTAGPGGDSADPPTQSPPPEVGGESVSETDQSQRTAHQGDPVRNDGGQPQPDVERRTVRVTDDIETFVGSDDRDYDLNREDIVTLPEPNATLLVERDAAEQL